jgi:predicted transcriptional regulator of viral defense system
VFTVERSLSPLEAKLVMHLEWNKQPVVTIEQAQSILGVSYDHARQLLHRLAESKWLAPIRAGRYELIPAERGAFAFPDPNPLFVGSALVEPYYLSGSTAAYFHALSTQAAATVYLATTRGKTRSLTVRDKAYRIVNQPEHQFFGQTKLDAFGSPVMMADAEKTVLDSLDRPQYAGGLPEVAAMLTNGGGHLDWVKVAHYALRFRSQALSQRLGYLADTLDIAVPSAAREALWQQVGKGIAYLGQPTRWGRGGDFDPTWQVVDNIPRRELLAEIQVR